MPKSISEFLSKHKIKTRIAVACSGGIDSLALAYLLRYSHDIVALVVDHGLRKHSATEAKQTAKILDGLGIKNEILKKKNRIKSNLQEEARKLRYGLLLDYCKKHEIQYLATAHHAEDNAETFLLRLSRGSGVDGLAGIAGISEVKGIKIIRPLLAYSKNELKQILIKNKINWVEDPTNKTDKYKRNKLRRALTQLEDSDLITRRINDAAENLARVRDFLEMEAEKVFKTCINSSTLNPRKLAELHDEIAYRVLVKIIMHFAKPEKKPRFEKLKRLKTDLVNGKTRTLNGLIFRTKGGEVIISIEKPPK